MVKKYKMTRKQLEDKVRQLELEPYEPTPERVEEIKQRAFEMYQRELNAKKRQEEKKAKKKSRRRRVVAVAALTVAFLVVSFVYNVLTPMTVANANSFMKRAVIWINDKLHLGIEFEAPLFDDSQIAKEGEIAFQSIDEASNETGFPIVYLPESASIKLDSIMVMVEDSQYSLLTLGYKIDGKAFSIAIKPLYDNTIFYTDEERKTIANPYIGDIIVWNADDFLMGRAYNKAYMISIFSTLSEDEFITNCMLIRTYN